MHERRPRRFAVHLFASLLVVPQLLAAQANLAQVEDASQPPRGFLRLRALTSWTRYDSRFTANGSELLGAPLTSDALGSASISELAAIESAISASSGTSFTLSLGRSKLNAVAREVVIPLALDYGLTNRLSVGVVVPIVQKRGTLLFLLDSTGSNVGPNPALTSAVASQRAGQLQAEFSTAAAQLEARLQACQANPSGAGCSGIVGREAEAQALIQSSRTFATLLASLFGSASASGMPFVPRTSTGAHAAIEQRVEDFNTRYRDFLASPVDLLVAVPMGAGGGVGSDEFERYLTADLGRDSLTTQEHLGIGDMEIGARFLVIDAPPTATRRRGLLLALAASVRLPTGSRQSAGEFADVRLGEGSTIVDTRAILDGRLGRFGFLASGQFATKVDEATPSAAASPAGTEAFYDSRRFTQLHIAPRWHASEPLSFHAAYSVRATDRNGGDQLAGGGVAFSTVNAFRTGATRAIPMEMRFTHLEAIAGDPGRPKFYRDQIEVRIYYRLRR